MNKVPFAAARGRAPRAAVLALSCLCWLLVGLAAVGRAAPPVPEHGAVAVCSAILYDLDQDAILFEQNADVPIPPASLTKVLSMFLALDQIRAGLASLNSPVTVSRLAARTGGSRMGLRQREQLTLEQLLTGMAVSSGNDASTAVAEFVGGSVPAFVNMMNAKARSLGMRDSVFRNPHGLPARGQVTTARDMLALARAYLRTYPEALRFHSTHVLNHRGSVTWNRNPLLGQYPGADGLKTGWTNASGYNLIFTATQGNRRLLAVIMGAPDSRTRSVEAFRLLDAGFKVCANQAVSVAAALDALPPNAYRPDPHLLAREASRLYAGADQTPRKQQVRKAARQQDKHLKAAKTKKAAGQKAARHKRADGQAARRVAAANQAS
ncbi:D-alanyl-D-alanine carboxypeptidase family protein [Desulfovibrio legallii]|uniref:Penicillin-binding protein 6. Serine peptidase. MEROPS family S11 n=1 Tax=Desulfovibrio legallii TaxID=571438 RepID=A0A1G7LY86_9BACT|nr:D-alanyl-D-alanine carboxypeptidase family protein [Desulfovibrio legallii]SDF54485.1 penicillin-binding protein 6. Serine peptidase. MEROPS family S11 [Desulfovibrio legallii]